MLPASQSGSHLLHEVFLERLSYRNNLVFREVYLGICPMWYNLIVIAIGFFKENIARRSFQQRYGHGDYVKVA